MYIYIPSIRRIRRATTTQRCQTLAPSEFNLDDINSFNGKITDFNYKFLGEKKMLANLSQEHLPFNRKQGDYLPLDEKWEVVDTYVLEITPKDSNYCYPRKFLHLNKMTFDTHWTLMWDKRGEYWKEQFGMFTPVKLADGREVWSVGRCRHRQCSKWSIDHRHGDAHPITRDIPPACSASRLWRASCAAAPSSKSSTSADAATSIFSCAFSCSLGSGLILALAPASFAAGAESAPKNPAVNENFYGVEIVSD